MQTIRVIKERPDDSDETMQWAIYWAVVAALFFLECVFGTVGVYDFLPLWNEVGIALAKTKRGT